MFFDFFLGIKIKPQEVRVGCLANDAFWPQTKNVNGKRKAKLMAKILKYVGISVQTWFAYLHSGFIKNRLMSMSIWSIFVSKNPSCVAPIVGNNYLHTTFGIYAVLQNFWHFYVLVLGCVGFWIST